MRNFLLRIRGWFSGLRVRLAGLLPEGAGIATRIGAVILGLFILFELGLAWYWSREPDSFWVRWETQEMPAVKGYATTDTLIQVARTLLDKPGGYLSNDIAPPGVFLDNIPSWEYGVLVQVRDLARTLRNDYSRSQTQSLEDPDLAVAEPAFNFNSERWILPSTEKKYREAIRSLERYQARLSDPADQDAQFFARADNLRDWLAIVEKRLGDLSQGNAGSTQTWRAIRRPPAPRRDRGTSRSRRPGSRSTTYSSRPEARPGRWLISSGPRNMTSATC